MIGLSYSKILAAFETFCSLPSTFARDSPLVILFGGLAQSVEGWVSEWEIAGTIVVAETILRFLKILRKKVIPLPCQRLDHNVARMIT